MDGRWDPRCGGRNGIDDECIAYSEQIPDDFNSRFLILGGGLGRGC